MKKKQNSFENISTNIEKELNDEHLKLEAEYLKLEEKCELVMQKIRKRKSSAKEVQKVS